ncbi:head-tail connector protein [Atlantibacter hermannii]|uniref:head-tail connector protein n=1 Tax=Atlantibacter hermannii TaxID=565 RepID=UPI0028967CC7|nr:head-tail connector protein [Atlantibacter hermannii]MDU7389335.1 head-tail connector protein [Atlantibacter hermannii]
MLDLDLVRKHCRIDDDFSGDDDLLAIYIGAAVRHVETWTRRTLYETATSPGYDENADHLLLTDDVKAAMLLLIGHWYENREATTPGQIMALPFAVDALLQPYRIYGM